MMNLSEAMSDKEPNMQQRGIAPSRRWREGDLPASSGDDYQWGAVV